MEGGRNRGREGWRKELKEGEGRESERRGRKEGRRWSMIPRTSPLPFTPHLSRSKP